MYHIYHNLFSKIIRSQSLHEFYHLFCVDTSAYWETHYTFGKVSKTTKKTITRAFVDLVLINTIIPIKFCYAQQTGEQVDDEILKLIQEIASEKNSIVEKFESLKPISISALQSQALIPLKNEYCNKNKCLQCAIGNALLTGNH